MDGLPTPRRYLAILAISFGTALAVIDGSMVTVALPTLARDLGVHSSEAVLVVTVYQLMLVMTLLPFSALGSRIGLRRLYQYGQLAFLLSTILCFFARNLPFLLLGARDAGDRRRRGAERVERADPLDLSGAPTRSRPGHRQRRGGEFGAIAPTLGRTGAVGGQLAVDLRRRFAPGIAVAAVGSAARCPIPQPHDDPYDVLAAVLCALTFGLIISGLESAVHGGAPRDSAAALVGGGAGDCGVVRAARTGIENADLAGRSADAAGARLVRRWADCWSSSGR